MGELQFYGSFADKLSSYFPVCLGPSHSSCTGLLFFRGWMDGLLCLALL